MQYTPGFPGIWGFNVLRGLPCPDVHLCLRADGNNHFISFEQRGVHARAGISPSRSSSKRLRTSCLLLPFLLLLISSSSSTSSFALARRRTRCNCRSKMLLGVAHELQLANFFFLFIFLCFFVPKHRPRSYFSSSAPSFEVNLTRSAFNFFAPSGVIAIRLSEKFT